VCIRIQYNLICTFDVAISNYTNQLKQQLQTAEASLQKSTLKHDQYNRYGAMLWGYILEAVKSQQIAEQYLIEVFTELTHTDLEKITLNGVNTFCSLQHLARKKIAIFAQSLTTCVGDDIKPKGIIIAGNRFIDLMNHDEQYVFCGVHYHGKSVATLAAELNKPETVIKQILKDSFTIIRNNRDTAAIH
jgi:hypothetical protein